MSVVVPGNAVIALLENASDSALIAAPYIKSLTLRKLIAALPTTVRELICVTRWLPEDIAAGVCDIEIFDDVASFPGGKLLVHPHLHAKFYRAAGQCLVGSANLTARGLGWITPSNVELLVRLPTDFEGIAAWEAILLRSGVVATVDLRDRIKAQAEMLKSSSVLLRVPEVDQGSEEQISTSAWAPRCPVPDRLWSVYQGHGAESMVSSAREAARDDLKALTPPEGLGQDLFNAYIAGILRQMPLMAELDELASLGLTDAQAYSFLSAKLVPDPDYPIEVRWRLLKKWLLHFFPQTYRIETGQEVLIKGQRLPR